MASRQTLGFEFGRTSPFRRLLGLGGHTLLVGVDRNRSRASAARYAGAVDEFGLR
ncbi:hypothetical protein [Streptomyces sp. Je 1-332]|uniref:hypothetical protein n=1 Tax=Streptomyces sp. Je 1-332 TaxID=3231270 RepID=UPI00345AA270